MSPAPTASGDDPQVRARRLERAVWGFVAVGVALRLARYAMDYPLWWDEAFVAVNLLRRGFLDLLRPLDYGQVCPPLFLWSELAVVRLLGFNEWTLRLFPMACAVASVPLFAFAAGRILSGVPRLVAVAVFAVSYHPIRHAADVKPYALDLFVALLILAVTLDGLRRSGSSRAGRLWLLAILAPLALGLSHPAVFVVAGAVAAWAPVVWRDGGLGRGGRVAYAAFAASSLAAFLVVYIGFTRHQAAATLSVMQEQWQSGFPPFDSPTALAGWLVRVHTGDLFAYPCGGERGGSVLTTALVVLGALALWRTRRRVALLACAAPYVLALAAAAIRRYPFGGVTDGSPARVVQYLVPAICLLAGAGGSVVLDLVRGARRRRRIGQAGLVALAAIGVAPLFAEARHPYRSYQAQRAREFARRFWPEVSRGGVTPVCLRWDLGLPGWDSVNLNVAVYLCNQAIYAPHRHRRSEATDGKRSVNPPDHLMRYILSLCDPSDPRVASWLDEMGRSRRLSSSRTVLLDTGEPGRPRRTERYVVYDFEARPVRR
ncbi:MAG: ArnT family glycosyltransferase [Isosphaeraceae bacterium]